MSGDALQVARSHFLQADGAKDSAIKQELHLRAAQASATIALVEEARNIAESLREIAGHLGPKVAFRADPDCETCSGRGFFDWFEGTAPDSPFHRGPCSCTLPEKEATP